MAENKTQPTSASPQDFLAAIADERRRADSAAICQLLQEVTGSAPRMWGENMVGFGTYRYTYASGRSGDWPVTAFSPRKQSLTVYIMPGLEQFEDTLAQLGKFKTGKSCLHFNKLSDIDPAVLRSLVAASVETLKAQYPVEM
ncbi:MAG TPA: DUF1801 domain-containing protein [Saprospiraceae bacterium]|nr:DUF1801 domain-containing protein [Saprospiraceae bacterium]HND89576.1 DUF1801 domain-containing protein [Saprospiraceae bacterium]HNG89778.1 DUF1801 domain-containing protein [Saprospiraceae bacterium]